MTTVLCLVPSHLQFLLMPHIEVLPNSSSHAAPGWAYVVDTGYSSASTASKPAGVRKRGGRDLGAGRADVSSRQNNAIIRHLAELDRENHKEVHIPVPAKQKDGAARCVLTNPTCLFHRWRANMASCQSKNHHERPPHLDVTEDLQKLLGR